MSASVSFGAETVILSHTARMNTVGKRIFHIRKLAGLTQEEFAKRLTGVTRGAVGNWEHEGGIKVENLQDIADTFNVTLDWVSRGRGAPPRAVTFPTSVKPSTFDPDAVEPDRPFEAEAPDDIDPDKPPKIPTNGIVELEARPGMGGGGQISHVYYRDGDEIVTRDAVKLHPWVFPPWFLSHLNAKPGDLMMAETEGDSMRPTIEPGTPVIIDLRYKIPSPDGVYAIRDRWGQIQIKRLETAKTLGDVTIKIISDNGGHVEIARSEDEISIVGKVRGGIILF